MKPGLVSGAAVGALIVLAAERCIDIANGHSWAWVGLAWDVSFAIAAICQMIGADRLAVTSQHHSTEAG